MQTLSFNTFIVELPTKSCPSLPSFNFREFTNSGSMEGSVRETFWVSKKPLTCLELPKV